MIPAAAAQGNELLNQLASADLAVLLPHLSEAILVPGQVLHEAGVPLDRVWFPTTGVVSLVVELDDLTTVEAASVGRDGLLGMSMFLGAATPTERASVQVAGSALVMGAEQFHHEVKVIDGPLEAVLRRYAQALFSQLARNAACNRSHSVRERAARWLLSTDDRVDGHRFDLTQEYLAQTLAVRRASVSGVAQELAEDGCITYTRGAITVLDRERLQANACGCYAALRQHDESRRSVA